MKNPFCKCAWQSMRYHARFIFVQNLCASAEKFGVFCFIEPPFIDAVYEDLLKIAFVLVL